jgi:hypothetical protein
MTICMVARALMVMFLLFVYGLVSDGLECLM